KRSMHIHDVADHQRTAFVAAQNAGRECPRNLQPADILSSDLLELGITLIGIIPGRHNPVFWVLRHLHELVVCMGGPRGEDRGSTQAGRKKKSAHRNLPADNARMTDARAQPLPPVGTPVWREMVSGNVTARQSICPAVLGRSVRLPAELTCLCRKTVATKLMLACSPSQPKL